MIKSLLFCLLLLLSATATAQNRTVYATVVDSTPVYASGEVRRVCQPYQEIHYPTVPVKTVVDGKVVSDTYGLYYDGPVVLESTVQVPVAYGSTQYCHAEYENPLQLVGYDVTFFFQGGHYVSRLASAPANGTIMPISIP